MADITGRLDDTKPIEIVTAPVVALDGRPFTPVPRRPSRHLDRLARVLLIALLLMTAGYWAMDFMRANVDAGIAGRTFDKVHDDAEHVITIGGIVLERNRHVVVGSVLGCAAGAALGAGAAVIAGVFTAGAGFVAIPAVSAAGCALLGMGGAAVGSGLDDAYLDL